MDCVNPAFDVINADAGGAVLISVPHAGRDYDDALRARLRPPIEKLLPLEDRMVDAVARGQTLAPAIIARSPRVWIDLNRHEAEIDPGFIDGISPTRTMLTPKVRNGLGLVPRRLAGTGDLWRGKLQIEDVEARIAEVHRPYHGWLADRLSKTVEAYGIAILIDLHSMPPLAPKAGEISPRIVIGNRFGQSAAPWLSARAAQISARFGWSWRENSPYAGGHIVERHGRPARGVHAVQVELDRSLYLDAGLDRCDADGLATVQAFLADLIRTLQADAADWSWPQAAE